MIDPSFERISRHAVRLFKKNKHRTSLTRYALPKEEIKY